MINKQDPRVIRTRQLIKVAFRDLLRRKGFDAITVKEISQQADINRATYYSHFEDKYALLEETTEQAFHEMIPKQVENAEKFSNEICDQLVLVTYQYIVEFYRTCRINSNSMSTIVDNKIKRMLQQTIENIFLKENSHHVTDRNYLKILAAMTSSAIYGAAHYWLINNERNQSDLPMDTIRSYVMNGLGLNNNRS